MNETPPPMVDVPGALWVLVGIAVVLLLWSLIRPRKAAEADPLPQRRHPIDDASRAARDAQCDAVLAESYRNPDYYLAVRLAPYEGELSFLAEACLELDENLPAPGEEGDHEHA